MEMKQHHPLYEALGGIVGQAFVKDDKQSLVTYSKDMSSNPPVMSGVIVRPSTTEEVSEIVKLANRTGYPIILRGGGESANGVTTGSPTRNIVIDTGRMDQVFDIDIANGRVCFGAGVRPSMLDAALKPYGYFAHTVLGPYYTDSMGGLLSGVSGGGYPRDMASAGLLWRHLIGFKVVLPTGEIVTTGAGPDSNRNRDKIYYREASSPDLTGLFMSAGGAFGIITEITEMIYKIATVTKSFSFSFETLKDCWDAQDELSKHAPTLHTQLMVQDMMTMKKFGVQASGAFCMLLTVDGDCEEDVDLRIKRITEICMKKGQPGDAKTNWFATYGMAGTADLCRDTCSQVCPFLSWECLYPRTGSMELGLKLAAVMDKHDEETLKKYGADKVFYSVPVSNYILVGVTMHWNDEVPGAGEYMLGIWKEGAELLNKEGTCSAYTQGNNSKVISKMWSPQYYNLMKTLKTALDPNNIMCPGLWNL